jgi:cyclic pyranopterin phosphate synthase
VSASGQFTHFDPKGNAVMVDVTEKEVTDRRAIATCQVINADAPGELFLDRGEDPVITTARIAGLQGAKQTSRLIPLCHPIALSALQLTFALTDEAIVIEATAETSGETGVEMEALTACAVAALSLVHSLGPTSPAIAIDGLQLREKSGGRSGLWQRNQLA